MLGSGRTSNPAHNRGPKYLVFSSDFVISTEGRNLLFVPGDTNLALRSATNRRTKNAVGKEQISPFGRNDKV
jgi:hypothetical protein